MLSGRQAWQLPSRWRLHSHWRTHVSADLLKGFDSTCPERHRLIRWRWVSSARAGLIRTIGTAHQPVARWRVRTEVFALMIWSRSTSGDFGKFISESLERAKSKFASCHSIALSRSILRISGQYSPMEICDFDSSQVMSSHNCSLARSATWRATRARRLPARHDPALSSAVPGRWAKARPAPGSHPVGVAGSDRIKSSDGPP